MEQAGTRGRRCRRSRAAAVLARNAVAGIVPGDHVCASFGSDEQHKALVGRYARQALGRGERFLYRSHETPDATIRVVLESEGIDVDAGLAVGQIEIRRMYDGERRDPEAVVAALQADRRDALYRGYSGLSVAAEMSWARAGDLAAAVRYERAIDGVLAAAGIAGLCQYDRRRFASDVLGRLMSAHGFQICTDAHLATTARRRLTISERADGVIALSGALDLDAAAYLRVRLAAVDTAGDLVVLTSGLGFADISGCRTLVAVAESLRGERRMILPDAADPLVRVLDLCGWSEHPRLVLPE